MPVDEFIPAHLCDVKGCHSPQFGEALEVRVSGMTLNVRVNPCPAHYRMIEQAGASRLIGGGKIAEAR